MPGRCMCGDSQCPSCGTAQGTRIPGDTSYRGDTCEICGQSAKPIRFAGKRRRPHRCPHGRDCARGHRLLGVHANAAETCRECRALGRFDERKAAV